MKKFFKGIPFLLIFVLFISFFSGCALFGPSSVGTFKNPNGISSPISFNDYIFLEYTDRQYGHLTIMSYVKQNDSKIADLLSQMSQDGKTTWEDFIKDYFKKSLEESAILLDKYKELNLSLNEDDKKKVDTTFDQLKESLGTDVFTKLRAELRLSEENMKKLLEKNIKISKVIYSLTDKGGLINIPEDELTKEYSENVKVKHILLSKQKDDGSGNSVDLTETEKKEKKKTADDLVAQIKNGADFDKLMNENTEDPGLEQNPNGYVFKQNGQMVIEFETAAFDMKVGDVRLVETSLGYHIMKKEELIDDDKTNIEQNIQGVKYNTLLNEWKESYTFTFDSNIIDKYSLLNLKDITA